MIALHLPHPHHIAGWVAVAGGCYIAVVVGLLVYTGRLP